MTIVVPRDLDRFASEIRDRREQLGLSVRALAGRANVSPAYITAIETARNPSTGRPPVPSVHIVAQLAAALELDVQQLVQAIGIPAARTESLAEHVLLYYLVAPATSLLPRIERLFGSTVDHWLYIADPRSAQPDTGSRVTIRRWNLGSYPYETLHLDPNDIIDALESEVRALAKSHAGQRVGLVIADCSAVMRYIQNAATEVELERSWHDHVHRIWNAHLHAPPAIDICAYCHDDIDALGVTIDQLATALTLISHHDRVIVVDNDVTAGAPAIRRILQGVRPAGVSATAWRYLTEAASETFATTPGR